MRDELLSENTSLMSSLFESYYLLNLHSLCGTLSFFLTVAGAVPSMEEEFNLVILHRVFVRAA